MKSFIFRLETVLALRTREEERVREICAEALRKQSAAMSALATANGELEAYHTAISQQRSGRTNRTEQILLLSAIQQQQANCKLLVARCAAADREVAIRRGELLVARRKREALANLKDRQRDAHRLAAERQEEATIADIITARHVLNMQEALS